MTKQLPSSYGMIPLGNVLNGQDIRAPDWAGMLEPAHGQMARFGARHRLLGVDAPWQTTSPTYTALTSNPLGPRLSEYGQGLRLWRDWTTLANVRRVGLVAWAQGAQVDLEIELWAEDTNVLWGTLNLVQPSASFVWASASLEVNAASARKAGLLANAPRQLFPKMRALRTSGAEAWLYEVIVQEYVIQSADV